MRDKAEYHLIVKAQRGDTQAFDKLEETVRNKVKGSISSFIYNKSEVDELYQIAIIKAWSKICKFRNDSSFHTWLTRIALNAAKDLIRKNKRRPISLDEASMINGRSQSTLPRYSERLFLDIFGRRTACENEAPRLIALQEERNRLDSALSCIPREHGDILKMVVLDGFSYKQVAVKFKIPIGTVMSRIFYAKKYMREILKKKYKGDYVNL